VTDPPSPTGSSRTNLVSLLTTIYVKPLHNITGACARMEGEGGEGFSFSPACIFI